MDFSNELFSKEENKKLNRLCEIRQQNNDISFRLLDYLNDNPRLITEDLMKSVFDGEKNLNEFVFVALMSGICGFDIENKDDKFLVETYLRPSVKMLDAAKYLENPYYKKVMFPNKTCGNWQFTYEKYNPYEVFVRNDIVEYDNFREIPQIGFFDKNFLFPAVLENNREWMSVKPNEVETMQPAIDIVKGNVVAFGLGLGYFPYMASLKNNVSQITIVERDAELIEAFKELILPQFDNKEKIEIVKRDAFDFIDNVMCQKEYAFAFVDLWHDASDGLSIYCKVKKKERICPQTKFLYWIENSLISALRWQMFDWVVANAKTYEEVEKGLSKEFVKKWASCNF